MVAILLLSYYSGENIGMFSSFSCDNIREETRTHGITDEGLLNGDLHALKDFLYNNLTQAIIFF